jgi:putative Mg2+ transporter-C (MgtC) family protein|tara:strand:+ start:637 stop:1044 length:408 start_codon:yes stop_codon:yes gene_type:complete
MVAESEIILRLVLAAIAGGIIGYERKTVNKPAGIRTNMLVSTGAALFTLISLTAFGNTDPTRIAAGIVTGIGFLGAGTIFRAKDQVRGLTTAASLWAVAAIGLSIAVGLYLLSAVAVVLILIILQLNKISFLREL